MEFYWEQNGKEVLLSELTNLDNLVLYVEVVGSIVNKASAKVVKKKLPNTLTDKYGRSFYKVPSFVQEKFDKIIKDKFG